MNVGDFVVIKDFVEYEDEQYRPGDVGVVVWRDTISSCARVRFKDNDEYIYSENETVVIRQANFVDWLRGQFVGLLV